MSHELPGSAVNTWNRDKLLCLADRGRGARQQFCLVCAAAAAHYAPPQALLLIAGFGESTSCVSGQRSA